MAEINTRKRGTKWEYYFESAKINGERKRISKGGFPTKHEALEAGTKALAEYNNAGFHFTPSEISYADYLDFWLDIYCKANLKPITLENYNKKIKLHIKPVLGMYKLKALTPAVLQNFLNDIFNRGYSRNTLAVIKGIITGSLSYAVEPARYIQNSPAVYIKLPSSRATPDTPTRTEPHVYITPDKIAQIFERFPEGTSTHVALQLGYKCGLRLGEAFALLWDDVNFTNKKITINRQVQWSATEKQWYFSAPKYNSIRTIEISTDLCELLEREKHKQEKAKDYYAELYTYNYVDAKGYLSTIPNGNPINLIMIRENGDYIIPRTMQHTSGIIHHKLNYPEFDYHSLRHTHATMLAERGAPPKYVQSRLGHKNIQVTMQIYQHLTETMTEQGRAILEDIK